MTPNKEDYLKCIYEIGTQHEKISNKEIAARMQVSPPAVTEMVKRMISENLLIKDKTHGYLLTEQLRAVERVRRDGAVCLRAAVFGLYPLVFLGIEFLAFHSLRSLAGYLLSLGFYFCYEAAQLRFRWKIRGLMNALEGGGF